MASTLTKKPSASRRTTASRPTPPTVKQLRYLQYLGFSGQVDSAKEAYSLIRDLLANDRLDREFRAIVRSSR
jgi:hypothetical protein